MLMAKTRCFGCISCVFDVFKYYCENHHLIGVDAAHNPKLIFRVSDICIKNKVHSK